MPDPLTSEQQRVLNYCRSYFSENDQLPPSRTIQKHFGFASQTSANQHLKALLRKGFLEVNENGKYMFSRKSK